MLGIPTRIWKTWLRFTPIIALIMLLSGIMFYSAHLYGNIWFTILGATFTFAGGMYYGIKTLEEIRDEYNG